MERMGATRSREAMRMPISQMQAVSSSDQVGSPLALAWPKICRAVHSVVTNPHRHGTETATAVG